MQDNIAITKLLILTFLFGLSQKAHASGLWYVNGIHGSDGNNCRTPQTACATIGHAESLAVSGDTILVLPATYNERLTISKNLSIRGESATTTIIDGGQGGTVVTIANAAVQASLSQLTIRNGLSGISNPGALSVGASVITRNGGRSVVGGGISNSGTLTVSTTTFLRNGGVVGGGIYNRGTLTISSSTLVANYAAGEFGGAGGAIANDGVVTIINSTLDGNIAYGFGTVWTASGGALSNSGRASINNVTFTDNAAECHTVGSCNGFGGAISNAGTVTIQNSITADSQDSNNCYGSGITSAGYNLSSDGSCNFHNTGDLSNTNPLLGSLANNGGPTETNALQTGSPAIDAGNPAGCTDGNGRLVRSDQRGMPRPDPEDSGGCDMGAYESQTGLALSNGEEPWNVLADKSNPDSNHCQTVRVDGEWVLTGLCTIHTFGNMCGARRSNSCPAGTKAIRPQGSGCGAPPPLAWIDVARGC